MQAAPRSTLTWAQPITHMPALLAQQPVSLVTLRNFRSMPRSTATTSASPFASRAALRMGPLRLCVTAASNSSKPGEDSQQSPTPAKTAWWSQVAPKFLVAGAVALSLLTPSVARAKTGSDPTTMPSGVAATGTAQPTWRDTGILLAAKETKEDDTTTWVSPEQLDAEARASLNRYADEKTQKQLKRGWQPSKGGKLVRDPKRSRVPDPTTIPPNSEIEKMALQSAWRPDKLKDMTYTQFWNLVGERQVEKASYSLDRRSIYVTTKASAPGGARTEKVGLPFDPDLFDHMVEHG